MSDVELSLNGLPTRNWTELRYQSDLENVSDGYAVRMSRDKSERGAAAIVRPLQECRLSLDGTRVLTGWVDGVEFSLDGESYALAVTGRDKSADLVDCSAYHTPGEWKRINLYDLGRRLCEPFAVAISYTSDVAERMVQVFDVVALESGETAYECLERHARQRGVLMRADGKGGIEFYRAGYELASVEIVQGVNLLDIRASVDYTERFATYRVRAQAQATKRRSGEAAAHVVGDAVDARIDRTRTRIINAERGLTAAEAKRRALWEASIRAARSTTVDVTLNGWEMQRGRGKLWQKGMLVNVDSEAAQLNDTLLIASVELTLSDEGARTRLKLVPPGAYDPDPETAEKAVRKKAKDKSGPAFRDNGKGFYDVIEVR